MQRLIEIEKDSTILVSSRVLEYKNPDYVYMPIMNDGHLMIKKDMPVLIGSLLFKNDKNTVISPVSGKVTAIKEMSDGYNKKKFIEINNDFRESKIIEPIKKKNMLNIKVPVLDKLLAEQFDICLNSKKRIILNCIDDDPYTLSENFYLRLYYEGFLELLDKLTRIYDLEVMVCVKSNSSENISQLMECLGMYPNIKLNILPNLYLLGNKEILLNYLGYTNDTEVVKASLFYKVYNLLLRNRQTGDKLITISGNGLNNPSVISLKIGTKALDVINDLIDVTRDDVCYIVNGLLGGSMIDIQLLVVTDNIDSILIMQKKDDFKTSKCMNCGECISICPVGINPLLLNNKEYYKNNINRCIHCGLCSYICPSYINFKERDGL